MVYTSFIVLLTCFTPVTLSKLYEHISDLPGLDYDFVIVGGGTAGNVVANRLTENPEFSVLVLEAGVSNEGLLASDAPFLLSGLFGKNNLNWNYTTTPQAGLNHRVIEFPRTHILGGCTAQNAMFYTRGTAEDFDRYADLTGDLGWSWNRVFPYFLKNEKWSPPADDHNTHGQFNPAFHSTQGETSVSLNGFSWSTFEQKVLQTTQQLPDEFPFNLDMNSGRPLGVGYKSTIGGGRRSSSATSYLAPKYIQRKNLHVLLHAQVSKLVDAKGSHRKAEVQVEYNSDTALRSLQQKPPRKLFLSAGPVGTPHILMNSGIGDRNILDAAGVHTILDLPSVGKNASDHPHYLTSWSEFGTTHIAWLRLDPDAPIFEAHTDPSAGPETPHIELFFTPNSHTGAKGHFMNIAMVLVSPVSRGSVSINSSDPFDPPLIDPGLLTSDFDLFALREGALNAPNDSSLLRPGGIILLRLSRISKI
ncbi:GMC oxidoreductase-domain-containing protein [Mycena rebaudengoi]|nr:GMC oxidoreductase-domain-containing protein [Mycena rebaudengoi]